MLANKKLSDITEADVRAFLDNAVREGKSIEYKRGLPGNSEKDRKEFLADISSFANTSGGHIICGIDAPDGLPISIPGIPGLNLDAEILRLENMAQTGIEPRIPGLTYQDVQIKGSDPVFLIHVPKSWIFPHMIVFQDYSRFYARNSAGKYILDVNELRTSFVASEVISIKINSFRLERISKIVSGDTPIVLKDGSRIILHIVPYGFNNPSARIDVTKIAMVPLLRPIHSPGGFNPKHNLDGYVNYSDLRSTYMLLFRNGSIEAVNTELLYKEKTPDGRTISYFYPEQIEEEILERLHEYLIYLKSTGINTPLVIMLTFTGVKGFLLAGKSYGTYGLPIDRDILIIPEIVLENYESDIESSIKPIFDAMWNAAGIAKSPFYDEAGKRKPR